MCHKFHQGPQKSKQLITEREKFSAFPYRSLPLETTNQAAGGLRCCKVLHPIFTNFQQSQSMSRFGATPFPSQLIQESFTAGNFSRLCIFLEKQRLSPVLFTLPKKKKKNVPSNKLQSPSQKRRQQLLLLLWRAKSRQLNRHTIIISDYAGKTESCWFILRKKFPNRESGGLGLMWKVSFFSQEWSAWHDWQFSRDPKKRFQIQGSVNREWRI